MVNSNTLLTPAELAAKCINQTNKPVFLTGKAGTGKTTFLRQIINKTHKNTIIVAPTGIAAINAGGVTLHSMFFLPFGMFVPDSSYAINSTEVKINTPYSLIRQLKMGDQKRKLLQEVELMIIDEVSMLRADLLDAIDAVLKSVRRKNHLPFGGVQVLFIGDLMQLPPVVKDAEWNVLRNYYKSIYFFDAHVLRNEKPVYIELDKIYRQSDNHFIDLLNNLRNNKVTKENVDLLNSYYQPNFNVKQALNTITLTTHNNTADTLNKQALLSLQGTPYYFNATIDGEFNEFAYPLETRLELKVGAQVMFIKNDTSGKGQYFNGKIANVSKVNDKEIEVDFKDGKTPFLIENHKWENIRFELNEATNEIEEKVIGTFLHYPIKLAWAITVHKSQGLTFEKAILDINRVFAPGQAYVALSRLKSLDGLVLTEPIQFANITQDKALVEYAENKPDVKMVSELIDNEKVVFLKSFVINPFDYNWTHTQILTHTKSYDKEENKSNKQKYIDWALALLADFEPLKINADKFSNQLLLLFENKQPDYLSKVNDRLLAAKNYFYPILKELSKRIFIHIENIKDEKQVKIYIEELLALESMIYKHLQQLDKVVVVFESIILNKEINKNELKHTANQKERLDVISQSLAITKQAKGDEKKEKKKKPSLTQKVGKTNEPKKPKVAKPDTKLISYQFFKEGKSAFEIAQERGFAEGTIETHLAHYVSLGMIPATQFVTAEKIKTIISYSKKNDTTLFTPIKIGLGEDYTYTEIRFALASQKLISDVQL